MEFWLLASNAHVTFVTAVKAPSIAGPVPGGEPRSKQEEQPQQLAVRVQQSFVQCLLRWCCCGCSKHHIFNTPLPRDRTTHCSLICRMVPSALLLKREMITKATLQQKPLSQDLELLTSLRLWDLSNTAEQAGGREMATL